MGVVLEIPGLYWQPEERIRRSATKRAPLDEDFSTSDAGWPRTVFAVNISPPARLTRIHSSGRRAGVAACHCVSAWFGPNRQRGAVLAVRRCAPLGALRLCAHKCRAESPAGCMRSIHTACPPTLPKKKKPSRRRQCKSRDLPQNRVTTWENTLELRGSAVRTQGKHPTLADTAALAATSCRAVHLRAGCQMGQRVQRSPLPVMTHWEVATVAAISISERRGDCVRRGWSAE